MAIGDIGGAITQLIITCRTVPYGKVSIRKNDAVTLCGPYTVGNVNPDDEPVFGQAMTDADENDQAIPVRVRGVCIFEYDGPCPMVNGFAGVLTSKPDGMVKASVIDCGYGVNLKVDEAVKLVHVLL